MRCLLPGLLLFSIGLGGVNCQTIIQLEVVQPEVLSADAGIDSVITGGSSFTLGTIPVASGGEEPYSFVWYTGTTAFSSEANPIVHPAVRTTYKVEVTDEHSCTATDSVTLDILVTGLDERHVQLLRIYPNPAYELFHVDFPGHSGTMTLYNEQGIQLWSGPFEGSTSFVSPEKPGTYLLKIQEGKTLVIRKIIVNR